MEFRTFLLLSFSFLSLCAAEKPPIQDLGEGRLQIGAVTLDPKQKSLSFPALVNMTTGLVEYAIVTTSGKTHESLLRTEAEPFHIHTAMLLLGVTNSTGTNSDTGAFFDPKRPIPGPKIKIEITLPDRDGKPGAVRPIETFLAHAKSKTQVGPGEIPHWIYNGSYFSEAPITSGPSAASPNPSRAFLAQREGSILSLIADPAALINNPRPDRQDDELWILHSPAIPPVHSPVQVRFTLP